MNRSPDMTEALAERVAVLERELAVRREEISALHEALTWFYNHWMAQDQQVQGRLQALEASKAVPASPPNRKARSSSASPDGRRVAYRELVPRIRAVVRDTVPAGATVAVISRGDGALLNLDGRTGWHFPQQDDGVYAGYYPADSAGAIAHLEALRARGARYLLIPATALWWLDFYGDFGRHLQNRYDVVVRRDDTCWIVDMGEASSAAGLPPVDGPANRSYHALQAQLRDYVALLLPEDAVTLVVSKGDDALLACCGPNAQHFPQDADGVYAGYYPADSDAAVAHLEALRHRGADFLLFPPTAFWWLDYYAEFREHLERHYRVVCRQQHLCLIVDLAGRPS